MRLLHRPSGMRHSTDRRLEGRTCVSTQTVLGVLLKVLRVGRIAIESVERDDTAVVLVGAR